MQSSKSSRKALLEDLLGPWSSSPHASGRVTSQSQTRNSRNISHRSRVEQKQSQNLSRLSQLEQLQVEDLSSARNQSSFFQPQIPPAHSNASATATSFQSSSASAQPYSTGLIEFPEATSSFVPYAEPGPAPQCLKKSPFAKKPSVKKHATKKAENDQIMEPVAPPPPRNSVQFSFTSSTATNVNGGLESSRSHQFNILNGPPDNNASMRTFENLDALNVIHRQEEGVQQTQRPIFYPLQKPSTTKASASLVMSHKSENTRRSVNNEEGIPGSPMNLSRPASAASFITEPLPRRPPTIASPSTSKLYQNQYRPSSRCGSVVSMNGQVNETVSSMDLRKSAISKNSSAARVSNFATGSNPTLSSVQNLSIQERQGNMRPLSRSENINQRRQQCKGSIEDLASDDEFDDIQIIDETGQRTMVGQTNESSNSQRIETLSSNPPPVCVSPHSTLQQSCVGNRTPAHTPARNINTPTSFLQQSLGALNLSQTHRNGSSAQVNVQQQQQQQMSLNVGGASRGYSGLGGGVVPPGTMPMSSILTRNAQHTVKILNDPRQNQSALHGAGQNGIGNVQQPMNLMSHIRFNQAMLPRRSSASLMLKDGCRMEIEKSLAEARMNNEPTTNILYHTEPPRSFKGLTLKTVEGGYSDVLVSRLEENYMKYRSLVLSKEGGIMTPLRFLTEICERMNINIHAEVFRFREQNSDVQFRTELYVGGFCGLAHSQNQGFSKQLAAAHVLERMRMHFKCIKPTYYAVYPGSRYTKIKGKLEHLCQTFDLGHAQYFAVDLRRGRSNNDDSQPRWQCSVTVQNKEACVHSDNSEYGVCMAARNLYTSFVKPPAVSVVQINDYFAIGAECPLLNQIHPSLLLNIPSKNKLQWKEENGLSKIESWLQDPTNESRYLLQTNSSGSTNLNELRQVLEEAVEWAIYKHRRGNVHPMITRNSGNQMQMMDIDDCDDDGSDDFQDAEDTIVEQPAH